MADFTDPAVAATGTDSAQDGQTGNDLLAALTRGFRAQSKTLELEIVDADANTWVVRLDAVIPYETFQLWTLNAKTEGGLLGVDNLKLACDGLISQARAVLLGDEELRGRDGKPLTFDSPQLQQALHALDATDCARRFFRSDGALLSAYNELMREAGYLTAPSRRR